MIRVDPAVDRGIIDASSVMDGRIFFSHTELEKLHSYLIIQTTDLLRNTVVPI